MKKKILALFLVLTLSLSLVACGGGSDSSSSAEGDTSGSGEATEQYHIGLSMGTSNTEFTMKVVAEMENAVASDSNVELTTLSADGDASAQVTNIENFITMEVDSIVVYPVDPEICADAMKKAREAGIHVVIVDQMPSDTESFDVGISVSMHDLGVGVNEMASEWIDETFPDAADGEVKTAAVGTWSTEQFAERCDVFLTIADYNSKAVMSQSYDTGLANFATETATNVELLLQQHPDINAILCFTDSQAIAAEEAIQKNKDVLGLDLDKIGIFTVDHSSTSYELLGKSADGESTLRGIVTTNLDVGLQMFNCAMKDYNEADLVDGKIFFQDIYKIDTENMADFEQYIL